jgi:hypothetical protein
MNASSPLRADRVAARATAAAKAATALLLLLLLPTPDAEAAPPSPAPALVPSRGEMLYRNHCGECHTRRIHWRDQRLATDWPSLVTQVQRWQREARLNWGPDEVHDVARHLNDTVYRFPLGAPRADAARPRPLSRG